MAKKPSISTLLPGWASNTQLNTIFQSILDAFDNTLSRDGSSPNQLTADLDLNSNDVLNAGDIYTSNLYVEGTRVVSTATVPSWEGEWLTGTAYVKDDIVRNDGSTYICLVAHTSGTFSTDLTDNKWELFAQKGAAGAGTGDMVGSNNLSDVTNVATSRSNLGLSNLATTTGSAFALTLLAAVDASAARTLLGAQASDATLTSLSGLSLVAGDLLYATGADTLTRLAKGTAGQALVMNSGATAPEWAAASVTGESLDTELGEGTHSAAVTVTNLDGVDWVDLFGFVSSTYNTGANTIGALRIEFSNNNGSSWGSIQTVFSVTASMGTVTNGGLTSLSLVSGNGYGMVNTTFTVPSGCNAVRLTVSRTSGNGTVTGRMNLFSRSLR